ncbi:glycine betaine/proline transport system permease protein [Saccharicrinis carchari]|uniref:Glycine betaine/proline transport system permease protein n=1 Tax=Saccharicrinis carchari TaxID=1168039 RepID=A0A521AWV3_SACCC|nr:proline/glycine betaine ABC transporter permease [Saccharicrinis carchari]SMO39299.1 glycine betaine/proline transport system permease protein [Saccharicrinis carchari]
MILGEYIEDAINWLTENFSGVFEGISDFVSALVSGIEAFWLWTPFYIVIALFTVLAYWKAGRSTALFTLLGLVYIYFAGFWDETMQTLALVLASAIMALAMGIPLGIWSAKNKAVNSIVRPVLDFMQTMPAFVYLIPAVLFFGLGTVPGAFATIIFAMPPVVRLTTLGILQVPEDIVEATTAFGATPSQLLFKVQIPLAMPTILAGINQTIMMALSMVVIASMIGAKGLGVIVLQGISQLKIGLGFESGLAVVLLAIILDRITQSLGKKNG